MFTKKCEAPGCGAMISFIDMQMGGKMPVDAEPVKMVVRPTDLPVSYVQAYINEEKYGRMVDWIETDLGVTSLRYQTLDDMVGAIGLPREKLCTFCWSGCGT